MLLTSLPQPTATASISTAALRASNGRHWSDLDVLPITLSCTDSLLLGRHDLRLPAATHAAGTRDAVRGPLPLTPQPSVRATAEFAAGRTNAGDPIDPLAPECEASTMVPLSFADV